MLRAGGCVICGTARGCEGRRGHGGSGALLATRGGGPFGQINLIAAHRGLIREDPKRVFRLVLARSGAAQYARPRPGETAEVAPRRIPGLELGIAPRAIPHPASAPRIRRHTVRAYDQAVNDPLEQQELRAPVPRGTAFATGFIDRLMRQHPPLFADPAPAR